MMNPLKQIIGKIIMTKEEFKSLKVGDVFTLDGSGGLFEVKQIFRIDGVTEICYFWNWRAWWINECYPLLDKLKIINNKNDSHIHTWLTYVGFTDKYKYCSECGEEQYDL